MRYINAFFVVKEPQKCETQCETRNGGITKLIFCLFCFSGEIVKKKFTTMKGAFMECHRKVVFSKQMFSMTGKKNALFKPRWRFYEQLSFLLSNPKLKDWCTRYTRLDNDSSALDQNELHQPQGGDEECIVISSDSDSETDSCKPNVQRRRSFKSDTSHPLSSSSKSASLSHLSECDSIGEQIVSNNLDTYNPFAVKRAINESSISLPSSPKSASLSHLSEYESFDKRIKTKRLDSFISFAVNGACNESTSHQSTNGASLDSIDCFASFVAAKLREMDPDTRRIAQHKISNALFN